MSASTLHDSFASALLDPDAPVPAQARTHNGSSVQQRFAVYRNNVVVTLIDALAESFPVVQSLVGPAFFRAMARVFVLASPPAAHRHRVLARYGEGFANFIASFEPAAELRYLADVARLEHTRWQAFHAPPGPEDQPNGMRVATAATSALATQLAELANDPDALSRSHLRLHPSLQVIGSAFAIVSLWHAHQLDAAGRDAALAHIDLQQAQAALVFRAADDPAQVLVHAVPAATASLVAALCDGAPIVQAWSQAMAQAKAKAEAIAEPTQADDLDLSALLGLLLSQQLIVAIETAPPDAA